MYLDPDTRQHKCVELNCHFKIKVLGHKRHKITYYCQSNVLYSSLVQASQSTNYFFFDLTTIQISPLL